MRRRGVCAGRVMLEGGRLSIHGLRDSGDGMMRKNTPRGSKAERLGTDGLHVGCFMPYHLASTLFPV